MTQEHPPRPAPAPSVLDRVRERLNALHHWMEGTGFASNTLQFFLVWWNKLGTAGAIAVILAVVLPAGGYASLAYSTSRSIPGWIGDFGVEFEASDWDIQVFSLSATASDVKLRRDARSDPVLSAAEIEFDGSLWTVFSSLFSSGGAYNEITIRHGEVTVERSLTGDFNWSEFLDAVPEARRQAATDGLYSINAIHLEDLRVIYLEHVPGNSGGGVIKTSQSRVFFDGISGSILDIKRPDEKAEQPTSFALKARLADGIIEAKGRAGIFPEQLTGVSVQRVSTTDRTLVAGPGFQVRMYLENIGMGAFGQMVATTQIVPTSGSVRGNIEMQQTSIGMTCRCTLVMDNVAYAPNPQAVLVKARYDDLTRSLAKYRKSGPFDICESGVQTNKDPNLNSGSMSAVLASFNSQGVDQAPMSVRTLVARDQSALSGVVAKTLYDEFMRAPSGNSFLRDLKRLFGGR